MELVDPTPEGGALYGLLLKVPGLHRLLQSLSAGDEPRGTIGLWGMLRSINIDGPRINQTSDNGMYHYCIRPQHSNERIFCFRAFAVYFNLRNIE